MGFWDFLKREELARIKELEAKVHELTGELSDIQDEIVGIQEYKEIKNLAAYKEKIAKDIECLKSEHNKLQEIKDLDSYKDELDKEIQILKSECAKLNAQKAKLGLEVSIYEETLEYASFGLYTPHFSFETSEEFKVEIEKVRTKQKALIKAGNAVVGGENIQWNGSSEKGQAMVKRQKQLMMRAFNGEADSFIANVDWNNITRMEERLFKSREAIDKVYEKQGIYITADYYDLKAKELRLTHEYRLKKQAEREEQRAIREQMREEERAIREMEQAKIKAEKEERMYLQALEKARLEMGQAVGEQQAKLLAKIAELEAGLVNAETLKQKAISMAQQTKMGYVYVISNIGSFGDDVYKIGMTRRLDPMDRVRELGDASVPFSFDVHALIFSENAPELEATLHKEFDAQRVNMVNARREFFKVKLSDVRDVAERYGAKVDFTMIAEAEEYRETLRIKGKGATSTNQEQDDE